ncbi:MAG: HAMP domain-containing histidine kinase [Planctomycetia bacterium]|nr:HAMP domain-containing histidine kinase [Planctomycetia bacterium]
MPREAGSVRRGPLELSRPLVTLRMGFDLLLADSSRAITSDQRGHVQTMVVLCDDLLRLTHNYLDYAGLVQGTRPLCYGRFTVGAMVQEIDRQFAEDARGRRIAWECALEGPDLDVTTDAGRCQQIFGHLVSNALKYTPEGGEVRLTGRVDGPSWVVSVSDNGPGIPAEHVDRVFEPFYRLAREECPRVDGNGLGLAVCREMVGQLGGDIVLHSDRGQGTRVTVRLPVEGSDGASAARRRH